MDRGNLDIPESIDREGLVMVLRLTVHGRHCDAMLSPESFIRKLETRECHPRLPECVKGWICQICRDVNIIPNLYVTHLVCGNKDNNSPQHKSIGHLHSDRIRISQTAIGEYFVSGATVDIVVLSNIQAI